MKTKVTLLLVLFSLSLYAADTGHILIRCNDVLQIYLDGKFQGKTELQRNFPIRDVSAGQHEVKIMKDGYKPQIVTLYVDANAVSSYIVKPFIESVANKNEIIGSNKSIKIIEPEKIKGAYKNPEILRYSLLNNSGDKIKKISYILTFKKVMSKEVVQYKKYEYSGEILPGLSVRIDSEIKGLENYTLIKDNNIEIPKVYIKKEIVERNVYDSKRKERRMKKYTYYCVCWNDWDGKPHKIKYIEEQQYSAEQKRDGTQIELNSKGDKFIIVELKVVSVKTDVPQPVQGECEKLREELKEVGEKALIQYAKETYPILKNSGIKSITVNSTNFKKVNYVINDTNKISAKWHDIMEMYRKEKEVYAKTVLYKSILSHEVNGYYCAGPGSVAERFPDVWKKYRGAFPKLNQPNNPKPYLGHTSIKVNGNKSFVEIEIKEDKIVKLKYDTLQVYVYEENNKNKKKIMLVENGKLTQNVKRNKGLRVNKGKFKIYLPDIGKLGKHYQVFIIMIKENDVRNERGHTVFLR